MAASLLPLYLKEFYKNEPLFTESKIVTSIYQKSFEGALNSKMINKIKFDNIEEDLISHLNTPSYENLMKVAIDHSDALIRGSEELSDDINNYLNSSNKPVLDIILGSWNLILIFTLIKY